MWGRKKELRLHSVSMDIPTIDGDIVDGWQQGAARVRGYIHMCYLPKPEESHSDAYHECHEFIPEESKLLNTEGLPLLFNHENKLSIIGHVLTDVLNDSGDRVAFAALHGDCSLDGEAISNYMDTSLKKGRYRKVSLKHVFYPDPNNGNIKKDAVEISICKKDGRRKGAKILSYIPASEKRSYISSKKGAPHTSSKMSASAANADAQMEVDPPQPPTPSNPTDTAPSSNNENNSKSEENSQIIGKTQQQLAEMLVKQREEMKRREEAKTQELQELELLRKKERERAERRKRKQEKAEELEKQKLNDMGESLLKAIDEDFEEMGEDGKPRPVSEQLREHIANLIRVQDPGLRKSVSEFMRYTSAATQETAKRRKTMEDEVKRLKEEQDYIKMMNLQGRYSAANSESPLQSPSSRFTNLAETTANNIIETSSKRAPLTIPSLIPKGAQQQPQQQQQQHETQKQPQSKEDQIMKHLSGASDEQKLQFFSSWVHQNPGIRAEIARQVFNNIMGAGVSAASADGTVQTRPECRSLGLRETNPSLFRQMVNTRFENNSLKLRYDDDMK